MSSAIFFLALALGLMVAGSFVLWLTHRVQAMAYTKKVIQVLDFIVYFLWELVKASVRVTYEILTRPITCCLGSSPSRWTSSRTSRSWCSRRSSP